MPEVTIKTKFYTECQNNSGGYFDHDEKAGVGYAICVEATGPKDAESRVRRIVESYGSSGSCPCCGDRWSPYFTKSDGTEQPMKYNKPLTGGWGIPSYVHYIDGRIERRECDQ